MSKYLKSYVRVHMKRKIVNAHWQWMYVHDDDDDVKFKKRKHSKIKTAEKLHYSMNFVRRRN